jgi:hypothetical protein
VRFLVILVRVIFVGCVGPVIFVGSIGSVAIGSVAIGSVAIGSVAIGSVAIGSIAIGNVARHAEPLAPYDPIADHQACGDFGAPVCLRVCALSCAKKSRKSVP